MDIINTITTWAASTGIKIVIALIVLFIAFKVINLIERRLGKKLAENEEKWDPTIVKSLLHAGKILLKVVVVVCLAGYLGIETSSISALVASLGVCVGLAVNGTLSNLAGGVMIIVTRPFKLGDYISAQGQEGTVEEIQVCYTKILTVDNKTVYLPNSGVSTGTIVNFSEKALRRVDLDFSVAGNDPKVVKNLLLDVCANNARVLADPEPFARITDYGAGNGLKITLRAWCKSEEYWDTYFDLLDDVKDAFEANGIVVPFNQLDVHLKND